MCRCLKTVFPFDLKEIRPGFLPDTRHLLQLRVQVMLACYSLAMLLETVNCLGGVVQ